jgi:glycosyltransferase involved in cell wall biosynthesis
MKKKIILFISTNSTWGGSEVLWTQAARRLSQHHTVRAAVQYDYDLIRASIGERNNFLNLKERYQYPNVFIKLIQLIGRKKVLPADRLLNFVKEIPDLVVISQGNNAVGISYMQFFRDLHIPFVTLTQLVTESSWPGLSADNIHLMTALYDASSANFFVSTQNQRLHEKLVGGNTLKNKIVFNPFTKSSTTQNSYPDTNGVYKVALVGRLELFHKGYDLLVEVIKKDKWKGRPITFSIFGSGPHQQVLERWKQEYKIDNISIKQHVENVADIWEEHHILLMPSRMEGQSLSLIESMRFKRPSIVTRVGGVEELVEEGHSGFVAAYPTVEHLEKAMDRAWESRDQWKSMGEQAYGFITERHPADAVSYFIDQLSIFL